MTILLATFYAAVWSCLKVIWVDSTFAGKAFIAWVAQQFGWTLEHLKRTSDEPGFTVIPKRWVVERTYAWFRHYRRLSKDYEFLPTTSEMMIFGLYVNKVWNKWLSLAIPKDAPSVQHVGQPCS